MTNADVVRLAKALKALGETFNEPVSDVRAEAYFFALEDFSIGEVEDAIRYAIKHCKFFPRPAELREAIEGSVEDRAQLAWMELLQEIRRVGSWRPPTLTAATAATMQALWGSWEHLCATLPGEGPELLGWAKRFTSAYETAERSIDQRELGFSREEAKAFLAGVPKALEPRE